MTKRRALSGFQDRRGSRLGSHQLNPVSTAVGPSISVQTLILDTGGIYDTSLAVGAVPDHQFPYAWAISRVWFALGVDESGSSAETNTSFEFRVGDSFATYEVAATLTTEGDPLAGEVVTTAIPLMVVEAGQILVVAPTRLGVGSHDFDLERVTVGFDLVGVLLG